MGTGDGHTRRGTNGVHGAEAGVVAATGGGGAPSTAAEERGMRGIDDGAGDAATDNGGSRARETQWGQDAGGGTTGVTRDRDP
eukprot:1869483-Pleurochrysis_carterae.AAC.2